MYVMYQLCTYINASVHAARYVDVYETDFLLSDLLKPNAFYISQLTVF